MLLVLVPNETAALFGFGNSNRPAKQDTAIAKANAMDKIRATAAEDDYTAPTAGVGRREAARYGQARAAGKLACLDGGIGVSMVDWVMVNDNFCDCPLGGDDEPGTSACSRGEKIAVDGWNSPFDRSISREFRVSVLYRKLHPILLRVTAYNTPSPPADVL